MKKQIVTLMLSAAIFTTNPLFAMDSEEKSEEKGRMHKCPSCDSKLEFQKINESESKGALFVLPNDVLVKTLSFLPLKDVVHDVSLVSKAMYNLCQTPFIWENIAQREKIWIPKGLCAKNVFMSEAAEPIFMKKLDGLRLSGDLDKTLLLSIPRLKSFMQTEAPKRGFGVDDKQRKFTSTLGKRQFLLTEYSSLKAIPGLLEKILQNANITHISFSYVEPTSSLDNPLGSFSGGCRAPYESSILTIQYFIEEIETKKQ